MILETILQQEEFIILQVKEGRRPQEEKESKMVLLDREVLWLGVRMLTLQVVEVAAGMVAAVLVVRLLVMAVVEVAI
jgi:hypothetical protein